ncbi:hypothetical protein ACFE04_010347 [Oxalis oulophora]
MSLFSAAYGRIILLLFLLTITRCNANNKKKTIQCEKPSSCGDIPKISYPFRLHDDPKNCGDPNYELFCEKNTTVRYVFSEKFIVQSINYEKGTIRVVHEDLQKNNCSTIPRYSLSSYLHPFNSTKTIFSYYVRYIVFLGCEHEVKSSHYISISPCLNTTKSSQKKRYSNAVIGDFHVSDVEDSCSIDRMVPTSSSVNCKKNCSYLDVQSQMSYGVESIWSSDACEMCFTESGYCSIELLACEYRCGLACQFRSKINGTLSFLFLSFLFFFIKKVNMLKQSVDRESLRFYPLTCAFEENTKEIFKSNLIAILENCIADFC